MKLAPITVRDVAKAAGVHPGTVSRVLNERTRHLVKLETAERVEQIVEELGYEANPLARGLRTRRSYTVGVVIPDLTNPLFPPMVRGIEDALGPLGYTALITNTDSVPDRERRAFETLATRQVDGLIVATTASSAEVVGRASDDGTPLVLVNRGLDDRRCYAVTPDDTRGGELVADYLVELGHRDVGHLAGPQDLSPGRLRREAFAAALHRHGVELPAARVREVPSFTQAAGREPARRLIADHPDITAIFAANDLLALDCLAALAESGRRVPQDVSVVGFNDMPFADRFDPPLTTVHYSHYDMGVRAAELLLRQIGHADDGCHTVVLDVRLVKRGSAAPR